MLGGKKKGMKNNTDNQERKGRKKRIFLYSHDTYGLGHIRRTLKIANALSRDDASVLVASASPKAQSFYTQNGIDFINLPGIVKQRDGSYAPRDLDMELPELINLRSDILASSVKSFVPDIILIDKEPLGVGGELLNALDYARRNFKECQICVGFRDILDNPAAVKREWLERDTASILNKYFDHILVYGEREVFNFDEQYEMPTELLKKLQYVGFIDPGDEQITSELGVDLPHFKEARELTLVTAGGGGDGAELLLPFVELLESGEDLNQNFVLLTGPFLDKKLADRIWRLQDERRDVQVRFFLPEPRPLMKQSSRVFCMGGYNTMCEVVAQGIRPYVLGREVPRLEQSLRAQYFESMQWCYSLNFSAFHKEGLRALLLAPAPKQGALRFKAQGLGRLRELFLGLSSS